MQAQEAISDISLDVGNTKSMLEERTYFMMKKWRCTTCGYIYHGETPPDQCPVCKMHKSMKPGPLFVEVK